MQSCGIAADNAAPSARPEASYPGRKVNMSVIATAAARWGGARPNSGGARPNSGPLAGRVALRPFTHRGKGRTHSAVTIRFDRCNVCGQIGWQVVEAESLYDYDAGEGEGFDGPQPESDEDQALVHGPDCPIGKS